MKLGVAEKLLIAAYELENLGQRPFSAEDLVVAAWERYPDTFGLSGHVSAEGKALFPDSNRVFAEIMGSKPIRQRGFLEKVGSKTYQVTESGRSRAIQILSDGSPQVQSKTSLGREAKLELRRLLASRAFQKWCDDKGDEVTFMDACSLWGITPRSSAIELQSRISEANSLLDRADTAFAAGNVSLENSGDIVQPETIVSFRKMHEELQQFFAVELSVIRKRTDERL